MSNAERVRHRGRPQHKLDGILDCDAQAEDTEETSLESISSSISSQNRSVKVGSNVLFFAGSVIYVHIAIVDVKERNEEDYDYSDDENKTWDSYYILYACAASTYVISSLMEFCKTCWDHAHLSREQFMLEMACAVTFGIAATFELFGALLANDDDHPEPTYAANTASVHMYLINAVLALSDKPISCKSTRAALVGAGNVLFLIGSMIDVCISYFNSPTTSDDRWKTLTWFSLLSAVLWLIDSICYLTSDYLEIRRAKKKLESIQVPLLLRVNDEENEDDSISFINEI